MDYYIEITWDETAGVWCAICDEIPLALESNSFDRLIEKVKTMSHEILEMNNKATSGARLCFKIAHWENIA